MDRKGLECSQNVREIEEEGFVIYDLIGNVTAEDEIGNIPLDNERNSFELEVNTGEDNSNRPPDHKTNSDEPKEILDLEIFPHSPETPVLEQSDLPSPDLYPGIAPSFSSFLETLKSYFLQIFLKIWEIICKFLLYIFFKSEFEEPRNQPLSFPSPSSPAYFVRAASPSDYFRQDIIITEPIIFPPRRRPDYFRRFAYFQSCFWEDPATTETFTDLNEFL